MNDNLASANNDKVPVSIITGFLGAGKTTLLNNILSNPNGKKYAVIVNEFGQIGIDSNLVIGVDEEIFELNNGCVCCNVRGDLIRILGALFRRAGSFDAILVETTGLANPAPVAQTFFADDDISRKAKLDEIITLVDAKHALQTLKEYNEAVHQIAFADVIILNKIDSVTKDELQQVRDAIRSINSGVKIIETNKSIVDQSEIFGHDSYSLAKPEALNEYFKFEDEHNHDHGHDHGHGHSHGHDHHDHHHHHEHKNHYDGVESLAFSTEKPLRAELVADFLSKIIDTYGERLLRFKGILSMVGEDQPYIVNGVHMMVDADYSGKWGDDEPRISRMVFIGKDLPKEILESGFKSTIV